MLSGSGHRQVGQCLAVLGAWPAQFPHDTCLGVITVATGAGA
jgi:hypothetical protein